MEENTKENNVENKAENMSKNTGFQYEEGAKLRSCKHCGVMIPKKAKICPNCKLPQKKKPGRILPVLLFVVIIGAWIFGMVYIMNPDDISGQINRFFNRGRVTADLAALSNTVQGEITETAEKTMAWEETSIRDDDISQNEPAVQEAEDSAKEESSLTIPLIEERASTETDSSQADTSETDMDEGMAETDVEEDEVKAEAKEDTVKEAIEESELLLNQPVDDKKTNEKPKDDNKADKGRVSVKEDPDTADMSDVSDSSYMSDIEYAENTEDNVMTKLVNAGDYTEEEFRELCTEVGYKKLLREREQYLGAALTLEVTVISQVDGGLFDDNIYYLCKETDIQGIDRYYIIRDDRAAGEEEEASGEEAMLILEGDRLLIFGQLFDSCKLPAYLVSSRPIVPAVSMIYVDIEE